MKDENKRRVIIQVQITEPDENDEFTATISTYGHTYSDEHIISMLKRVTAKIAQQGKLELVKND